MLQIALRGEVGFADLIGQRAERFAFAENLQRHTLANVGLRAPIDVQRVRSPRQHVDEAGRHCHAGRIDVPSGVCLGQIPDRRDALAAHADIGLDRLLAAAIVDRSVAHDDVVLGRRWLDLACSQQQSEGYRQ